MKLIADSGSTKTDWRLIDNNGKIHQFKTDGINPYHQDHVEIYGILETQLEIDVMPDEIFFYGAGCSSDVTSEKVRKALIKRFDSSTSISIQSDILASARAVSGNEQSIVCILGTGSNACLYDGNEIVEQSPSLGYKLGDEGSGSWLGKNLIHDYYGKKMDTQSRKLFEAFYQDSLSTTIEKVYFDSKPASFLASFSELILKNMNEPYFYNLVYKGFMEFFEIHVKYFNRELPVHFTGSIAHYYSNILRRAGQDSGLMIKNIVQSPIAGLTLFHQNS